MAFGDVAGSNVANIGLILGAAAAIRSLDAHACVIRRGTPIAFAAALALWVLALDSGISRSDGMILLAGFGGFFYYLYQNEIGEVRAAGNISHGNPEAKTHRSADIAMIVGGLAALIAGAHLMVEAAVKIAAVGTWLPRMATAVVAAIRRHADIAAGNIAGSNIFNLETAFKLLPRLQTTVSVEEV